MSDEKAFLPAVDCSRGAPMGRPSIMDYPTHGRPLLYLRRFYLDSGGYDRSGAYWGHGEPLYAAFNDEYVADDPRPNQPIFLTFRARSREIAKHQVLEIYPGARFYR